MLKIPWTARKTNKEVLRSVNKDRELLKTAKHRKISCLGHIVRKSKIEGLRGVGRKQVSWVKNIRECTQIPNAEQLFHIAENQDFNEALYGIDEGILLNGERVNNVRYADETMVIADSLEGLQRLMDRINEYSQHYRLNNNTHKTKQMIISKENINGVHLYINGTQIERVKQYCYLRTIINEQWSHLQEIKCHIGKARTYELLDKYGYPLETHFVQTDDGYILALHRLPFGRNRTEADRRNNKPVILMMQGMFCSSMDYVNTGPGRALGLILAEAKYDVWLGNNRGTRWSRNHVKLNPDRDPEFWDFRYVLCYYLYI
ncbi:unnamed protein product [Diabrotica balteata]|uniref:Partial AB-hydrolase lipase domain-containing protein n=1 Tax=Diabrotica balteata TaxID=107213 RepID=A0A9N9T4Q3_DIABA|nr:unnamed protein product [Diabrotica balteata]